jgi:hypothetical protein
MNKITLAVVVAAGLALGLAAPRTEAAAIQTLSTPTLTAAQFNSLYTPYNNAILSPFQFDGTSSPSGLIQSQVFSGTGAATGTYAYAYQVAVNNQTDSSGTPVHVDSTSFKFNSTPLGTNFATGGQTAYGYIIPNGQVGGLNLSGTQAPTSLSWEPAGTTGFIRAQYVDPTTQAASLAAGSNSVTFALISTQLPSSTTPSVNVGGAAATTTVPVAYTTTPGTISPIPVPEPATWLAWSGMAAAVAMVRRIRKARLAVA